jgi:regulator of protease activity HflC (stomatin/prohibitin superfamily)
MPQLILVLVLIAVVVAFFKSVYIVPQKSAYLVERLGKYQHTLEAGMHVLIPFVDKISYRHTLKEQAIDVPSQTCITRDNIPVEVDGILYMQVTDP